MQAGAFKIGDTAGTLENAITCKLHRCEWGGLGIEREMTGMRCEEDR